MLATGASLAGSLAAAAGEGRAAGGASVVLRAKEAAGPSVAPETAVEEASGAPVVVSGPPVVAAGAAGEATGAAVASGALVAVSEAAVVAGGLLAAGLGRAMNGATPMMGELLSRRVRTARSGIGVVAGADVLTTASALVASWAPAVSPPEFRAMAGAAVAGAEVVLAAVVVVTVVVAVVVVAVVVDVGLTDVLALRKSEFSKRMTGL